jgi:2-polyprenyl-3-methyl-5-hydroxy-6-metoxy-1,4-benzoquinol methylase
VECKLGDVRDLSIPDHSFDVLTIMHVLHDIEPAKREETVKILAQKLKKEGSLFIREPIKKSHGIAMEEINTLMNRADLWELKHEENKAEYKGQFIKNE